MKKILSYIPVLILAGFGLLTLFLSSSVIFDLFDIRAKEGNYVLFIVWANFISSWLYLFAAYGFLTKKKWTVAPLLISSLLLIAAFVGLKIHINSGGSYELKTNSAMIFRIVLTLFFTLIAYLSVNRKFNFNKLKQ